MAGRVLAVLLLLGSTAQAVDREAARAHFQSAVELYDRGQYEPALLEFQQAQALSHNAELYFNMAACEEKMDHFQAAALLLRQYILEKPDAEDRKNVELRVRALEERDERLHKMGEPIATKAPPPASGPPRKRVASWILLGLTAGLGVSAIGTGSFTVVHHDELANGCGMTAAGCSQDDRDGLRATALATDVLIGLTAAAAVATVVVFIVEGRRPSSHAARAGFTF